jgi:signal transduction histidine kinase
VRRRIISLAVLSTLLCSALFAVPLGLVAAYYLQSRDRAELQRIAYGVASAAADNLTSGARLAAIERRTGGVSVGLYGPGDVLISGAANPAGAPLVRAALAGTPSDGVVHDRLAVSVPIIDRDAVVGAVLASRPRSALRWQIGLSWAGLAALAAAALAGSWALSRHQAGRLARPVEQLSLAAERLGDGDFSSTAAAIGIPEIDSVNRSLDQAASRLRSLLERERALGSDASHQIRTPLAGLRLLLERAAQSPQDSAAPIAAAQDIIQRLELTVTDMLQLVRGTPRAREPLVVAELVEHVVQRWQSTFGAHGRLLSVQVEPDLPDGYLPAGAARQILNVLVDNAGVHGQGGVTLLVRDAVGSLAIDVAQDGPPLAVTVQSLFTEPTGTSSGIGLPLARAIAEAAGARLILTSADPPTFTVLIPPLATS